MRIVADESVEAFVPEALRIAGHEVLEIAAYAPGTSDEDVLDVALARGDLLITNDKDFGDLVFARNKSHHGILLMRLSGMSPADKCARVVMLIGTHERELIGAFTIVNTKRIRIRRQT